MKGSSLLILLMIVFFILGIAQVIRFFAGEFPGQLNSWLYSNITHDAGSLSVLVHVIPVILGIFAVCAMAMAVISMYTFLKMFVL